MLMNPKYGSSSNYRHFPLNSMEITTLNHDFPKITIQAPVPEIQLISH